MGEPEQSAEVRSLAEVRAQNQVTQLSKQLARNDKGAVLGSVSNLVLIIGGDPVLKDMCSYNEFTCTAVLMRSPPKTSDTSPEMPGPYPRPWSA
jgi:hypothetical protein